MAFRQINTSDKNLQLIQSAIADAVAPLDSTPFVGGVKLTSLALIAGQDNLVAHKLGKTPTDFIVTWQGANSVIWTQASSAISNVSANASFLNLWCSANCTINLWVFG